MDKLFIQDLKIPVKVGIHRWERQIQQSVCLNLEIAVDIKAIAQKDDIKFTLDYAGVVERLVEFISTSEFFLIETLAERIAQLLIDEFKVKWLRLRLSKPNVFANSLTVGVEIERP